MLKEEWLSNSQSPGIKKRKYGWAGDRYNQGGNGEKIKKGEIDWSHGLGAPKNNDKSRPIIIKFARYNTRCRIFKNKKKWREKV